MRRRQLGASSLNVSVIGLGCAQMARFDEDEATRMVHRALDLGVNHFDTAEIYGEGRSEELLGKALKGRREHAYICTKANPAHLGRESLPRALEASLRRLGTDYVDLYYAHWVSREIPFEETMEAFARLKQEGKVRAIGVSNFGPRDLTAVLQCDRPAANQLPYNLLWRAVEHEIASICEREPIGIVCYNPQAKGLLTGKYRRVEDISEDLRTLTCLFEEDMLRLIFAALDKLRALSAELGATPGQIAMAWLLAQPAVACAIPGARTLQQLEENAAAGDLVLSVDHLRRLDDLSRPLRDTVGSDPDVIRAGRYR